nr:GNAT family N-acetyltransferase [Arthrobacter sp. Helios]
MTRASSARTFHEIRQHWYRHGFGVWTVVDPDDPQTLIGFTGVSHRIIRGRPALNLYYRYSPEYWGQGLATEGALEAVRLSEELLPGLPVVAYTSVDNLGSQRTALAAGLERREDLDVDRGTYLDIYLAKGW